MMINESEINSNKSVRNYYKSNLSNEYKKLKASLFLGEKISDEYIFSLIINAAYLDDTHTSSRAHFLLSKPLKDQNILFLIEYFRVVINNDYEHDRSLAPKLLKILMRRGYRSLLIKLILDSKNKKLRDFLLEKVEAYKSTSDREQLFLIYELWKSKIISRNEADRRLELFINNYKARQTFLSKPFSRKQAMAFMLVSIIYLQMNLVKKGNSLFAQIAANGVWTEKVVHTWYDGIEETYEKEIYDNDRRLVKTGAYFRTITFESKFPEICEQFKKNLKTDYQKLISQPINYSQLICNGLKTTNLIVYANETIKYARDLKTSESALNLYKFIHSSTGQHYDHKVLLSYIPTLQTLNDEFAESKTTKKFNNYFMSKNNYYHSALFLLLSKEALDVNGLDSNQIKDKFIKAFLRHGFSSGYSKSYYEDSYTFWGSPKKITVIYKYLYLYGNSTIRYWLEDLAILKSLVSSNFDEIEEVSTISLEKLMEFSVALNYHQPNLGEIYFKNISRKIDNLYSIDSFEEKFRSDLREVINLKPIDEIVDMLMTAHRTKNNELTIKTLKTLSLLNFNRKEKKTSLNKYLSNKDFVTSLGLFCKSLYSVDLERSWKKIQFKDGWKTINFSEFLNKLIFFYCDDDVYTATLNKNYGDSYMSYLQSVPNIFCSTTPPLSELAKKRYQQLKDNYKKNSNKVIEYNFIECIKDISLNYSPYNNAPIFSNKKHKAIGNNILFSSYVDNFEIVKIKKILEEQHFYKKMEQSVFIEFVTFLNDRFLHLENRSIFGRPSVDGTCLENKYKKTLENLIKEIVDEYALFHNLNRSEFFKALKDNQYEHKSIADDENEFKEIVLLFNKEPSKYFYNLWSGHSSRLFKDRNWDTGLRAIEPKINKHRFYFQLNHELNQVLNSKYLDENRYRLLSDVLKTLSDLKNKSYWIDIDRKSIEIINKYKPALINYVISKTQFIDNLSESLKYFNLITSNSNIFVSRKTEIKLVLEKIINDKNIDYDEKHKFLREIYDKRFALNLFGAGLYQNIINGFIEHLKDKIKYKRSSTILKYGLSNIDELAKAQILKVNKSKIKITYNQKININRRIQNLKFSKENRSFCKENNFDYWGLHLNIYG